MPRPLIGITARHVNTEDGFPATRILRAYVTAIGQRDYSMIMGTTLIYAFLVAVANLTVDIVYGFLDPRIKVGD